MSIKSFFKSKIFFWSLGTAFMLTIVIFFVVLLSLKRYTHHGESFPVPDLRGMDIEQAISVIKQNNLKHEIIDSVFQKSGLPGTIYEQTPAPGFYVKVKRTMFLTIYARNPEQVPMPLLTNVSLRQALNILLESGLNAGEIKYYPSEFHDLVLEQSIPAKKNVDKGSTVNLVIGQKGRRERVAVPNLKGVTFRQAKDELGALFLGTGSIIYDKTVVSSGDSMMSKVWKQNPASNTKLEMGKIVDLWMTLDSTLFQEPDTTLVPVIIDF